MPFPENLLTISSFSPEELAQVLALAKEVKENPKDYYSSFKNETLLMFFSKPSLRTRLSFESAMTQMGGHAIYYPLDENSNLGKKETLHDTAKCSSRYVNIIMARLHLRKDMEELAKHATVPVINALDDYAHPCQIVADFQTIIEKYGSLKDKKLTFMGDINNNVTFDLLRGGIMMGMHVTVCGPIGEQYNVNPDVICECKTLSEQPNAGTFRISHDPIQGMTDAHVVYSDTWMSYHISADQKQSRLDTFKPFQVTNELMKIANKQCIFMHCLPAQRGYEMTADVIDGPQSVVFDQAENRLHAQKAILLCLAGKHQKQ